MTGTTSATWIGAATCWVALVPAGLRWLRVSQREHYLPGAVSRFAFRWWIGVGYNVPLAAVAVAATGLSWRYSLVACVAAAAGLIGPIGLSPRGRTSPLAWTRRSRSLAAGWVVLEVVVVLVGFVVQEAAFVSALALVISAPLVDLVCFAMRPIEDRLASRYVSAARTRLRSVSPRIVGITGSYGKTSTKNYVTHLLAGSLRVVASPASFNNRSGLARAINENLIEQTDVFVAEMGTYGLGEIAELCSWCPPEIAVITAIGPVHLERFGSEEEILRAKSEITAQAATVILNVDDERLRDLADEIERRQFPPRVVRCSVTTPEADISLTEYDGQFEISIGGFPAGVVRLMAGVQPTNVACALAVGSQLGVPSSTMVDRLRDLPTVPHRLAIGTAASGVVVIDDTFNSNPAGARAALRVLADAAPDGRRVLVTPGMVELGRRQDDENRAYARESTDAATDLLVVGRTNRRALIEGRAEVGTRAFKTREEAVRWVRENLRRDDAVLYENDLPDHYP
jgi:UDP-N-acetylmuramoyl-tripeptide--D-alanyl-D-alanine ligase